VIRWHRAGFRAYWRWKSRSRAQKLQKLFQRFSDSMRILDQ
jgi:hypothetical protein